MSTVSKKGICVICSSVFEYTPGKRKRVTCSGKCRKIKYLDSTEGARKKDSLVHLRARLKMRLINVEKELVLLGWREKE